MTYSGGSNNVGAVFSYNISTHKDSVLHSFSVDSTDGRFPYGSLIQATNGLLYGMTESGGRMSDGMLFSYNITTGLGSDLHDFGSIAQDGVRPEGTLMQASDGNLYGMTSAGGSSFDGIVFSYNPSDSAYSSLSFNGVNGYIPYYGAMIEVQNYAVPVLVQSPAAQTICPNDSASFKATATGSGISEQWQVSTDGGATFTNIAGATDSIYSFMVSSTQNGYLYRAIISNPAGADTTSSAALQVTSISNVATVSSAVCTASQTGASYQWLDCGTGQPVSGATAQTYTATQSGSYRCIVTLGNCTDTTNCVNADIGGIVALTDFILNLYPNPNSGNFTIDFDYPAPVHVRIVNSLGSQVKEKITAKPGEQIDISELPAGIYQLMILDGTNLLKVVKVVRQ
jgi:uncharacterized repeat protein (TIGR03803 family)